MTRKLEFVIDRLNEDTEQEEEISSPTSSLTNFSIEETLKPDKMKIVTSFDDLRHLKPRCRQPIDIQYEKDDYLQSNQSSEKKYFSFLQTNKMFLGGKSKITESISSSSSSGYSSTSSSPSSSQNYQDILVETEQRQRKSLGPIVEKPKVKGRLSVDSNRNHNNHKVLTVLFDYESRGKEMLGDKVVFSVKKGELVKVLRDYDEKFHLVAKCKDNKIGFLPKDFTVDLIEVKTKVIQKSLIIAENLNYESRTQLKPCLAISHNYENSSNPLFKLTKL